MAAHHGGWLADLAASCLLVSKRSKFEFALVDKTLRMSVWGRSQDGEDFAWAGRATGVGGANGLYKLGSLFWLQQPPEPLR